MGGECHIVPVACQHRLRDCASFAPRRWPDSAPFGRHRRRRLVVAGWAAYGDLPRWQPLPAWFVCLAAARPRFRPRRRGGRGAGSMAGIPGMVTGFARRRASPGVATPAWPARSLRGHPATDSWKDEAGHRAPHRPAARPIAPATGAPFHGACRLKGFRGSARRARRDRSAWDGSQVHRPH